LSKKRDLFYSAGSFASGLPAAVFNTFIIFFYVDFLKMPAELIGLGMGIYGIWNAINDPLLGQISDKTRTKRGRRIPYILFGSIPLAITFVLVWTPPAGWHGNTTLMFMYFLAAVFLYDTLYTLVILNWTALFPEMYKTQEERTRVSAYRQVLGLIGTLIGTALPPMLYSIIGWGAMGIVFAALTLVTALISLLGSKEDMSYSETESLSIVESFKATFKNKSFLAYVLGFTFIEFTILMLQTVMPFYSKYVLGVEGFKVSLILGVLIIVSIFVVIPWAKVANKKGSKKTMLISVALYGIGMVPFWFIKGYLGALAAAAFVGIGLAGIITLIDVFIADIVDEDELKTGVRREGMYFGMNALFIRLAISAQSIIMGFVLKSTGYNPNLGVGSQPLSAINGLKLLLTVIPLITVVLSFICYKLYPLDGKKLEDVKSKVHILHTKNNSINM
jgi:GPH family glycoside/pentoside/hexuronide:cation symporter